MVRPRTDICYIPQVEAGLRYPGLHVSFAIPSEDEAVLRQIEQLGRMRGISKADVIRTTIKNELARETGKPKVQDLLAPIQAKLEAIAHVKRMTPEDRKTMSDELWGE